MSTAEAVQTPTKTGLRWPSFTAGTFGTALLLLIALPCFLSLPITLGTPSTAESGERYHDLRFDDENVPVDGKVVKVYSQEQEPGVVSYVREKTVDGEAQKTIYRVFEPMGTDQQGRSVLMRCLLGGAISLGVGISAALMAVFIGVTWGSLAGYVGGRTDAFMMRIVDVLYGLPYLLLVVLLSVAVGGLVDRFFAGTVALPDQVFIFNRTQPLTSLWTGLAWVAMSLTFGLVLLWLLDAAGNGLPKIGRGLTWLARIASLLFLLQAVAVVVIGVVVTAIWLGGDMIVNLLVLVVAIGGVSWLTMARVIRGQVLSLRTMPFIEAARAQGMGPWRIIRVHLLPNLIGPIVVYTTLAVPQAILQESFLSFLGIGVMPPLPSWGSLASEGIKELPALALPKLNDQFSWWLLVFPCLLLGLTLLSLNFMGDALRERFDPRSKRRGA
jgi:ABC-type dipeptide/oligopeptide/nickel transport system permease subunit